MGTTNLANRTVVLASPDASLRQRLNLSLTGLRWDVREANGGAEALACLEEHPSEALVLDHWLPDLEVTEFAAQITALYPGLDLLRMDGIPVGDGVRSPRRNEILYAMREALGAAARGSASDGSVSSGVEPTPDSAENSSFPEAQREMPAREAYFDPTNPLASRLDSLPTANVPSTVALEEMIGQTPEMLELAHLVRIVAPRSATVLIEGETGTGKEVVARAVHRLSQRSSKPFVILNCAAIPESLLEAELFGHTRGAFTGAVQARTGRIEAAHGGTLFLDEIGEMPFPLQAKMLRFLENGELQRVGDNEITRVDVRVIAATHQHLEQRATEGTFRLDLYHRLAVFPLEVPPLRTRIDDIAALSEHFLIRMGKTSPRKTLSPEALARLREYDWPGNVRELGHVLERACILAEDSPTIQPHDIRLRRRART